MTDDTRAQSGLTTTAEVDRVPLGMKFGYSMGDYAVNVAYQTTAFYLLFYFTDIFGILPSLAGVIFLYSKVWDATSDPIMGVIIDHTKSRWGKMRPYMLFGAIPFGLTFFLLFASPGIPESLRFWYGLFSFILFCTMITVVNVPYLALTPSLTQDSHERSVVTGYRSFFAILGALTAAGATLPLVGLLGGDDQVAGFRNVAILYGVIIVACTWITFATSKERIKLPKAEKVVIKEAFRVVLQNRPFIILTIGMLCLMVGMNIMAIVVTYYFKYFLNAEAMTPFAFLGLFVTAAVSLPLFVTISRKTSKKFTYNLGMGIYVFAAVLIFFFGHKRLPLGEAGFPIIIFFLVLAGVGLCTNWLSPWSMIPDTVEYAEWKTGVRPEGVLYGIFFFVTKLGTALAGFIVGNALEMVGYVANAQQTPEALFGIRTILTLLPSAFLVLGIVIISTYPISSEMYNKMLREIEEKRGVGP